jgi:hypothetical protein
MRLLPALAAHVVLGAAVLTAQAQEHPAQDSGKIRVAKFLYVPKPASSSAASATGLSG